MTCERTRRPQVSGLCEAKWRLIVSLACMRISDLESLYHNFQSTYQTQMQKAGFDNVLQRNSYFAAWKLRLISIRSLLEKHPLHAEMRSDLIQKILFEGNFWHAQQILTKLEAKKSPNVGTRGAGSRFHGPIGSEDTLKGEMKRLTASVSDSQFLLDIKKIGDEEMRTVIEQVENLVYEQLGYSIDKAVEAMTRVVLDMQRKRCRKSMQQKIESDKKKLLKDALTEFIRDINALSVGRRDSCVFLPFQHFKNNCLLSCSVVHVEGVDVTRNKLHAWYHGQGTYDIARFYHLDNLTSGFRVFGHRPPESDPSTQAEASSSHSGLNER
jgi:hypothetical protein